MASKGKTKKNDRINREAHEAGVSAIGERNKADTSRVNSEKETCVD